MNNTQINKHDISAFAMNPVMKGILKLHRCEDCPIRCQAAKKPHSIFARLHRWHSAWWPGWRVYQAELRERKAAAAATSD